MNNIICESIPEDGACVLATSNDVLSYYKNVYYSDKSDMTYSHINTYIHEQPKSKTVCFKWDCEVACDIETTKLVLYNKHSMVVWAEYLMSNKVTEIDIDNLYTNYDYAWQIIYKQKNGNTIKSEIKCFRTRPGRRIINIEGVKNVRDLGGIITKKGSVIKQGLLYRSGEIDTPDHRITENGILVSSNILNIKTEIDLRKPEQRGETSIIEQSLLGSNINYINYSCAEYNFFIELENRNESDIIRIFSDYANYPILFHCVYGADRTGTIAYLIEGLCGVELDELTKDYELTAWRNRTYEPYKALVAASLELPGESLSDKIYKFFNEKLSLSKMEISNIRNILTTNSAVFKSDSLKKPFNMSGEWVQFHIELRDCHYIKQVRGINEEFAYKLNGDILSIKTTDFSKSGMILFDDGGILEFCLN